MKKLIIINGLEWWYTNKGGELKLYPSKHLEDFYTFPNSRWNDDEARQIMEQIN